MLKECMQKLATDLGKDLSEISEEVNGGMQVTLPPSMELSLRELKPGVLFCSTIGEIPKERKEELFSYVMHANVLTQGTGGAALGMSEDEKFLTLSLSLAYELNYIEFKERLEEFSNFTMYWQEELEDFKKQSDESVIS